MLFKDKLRIGAWHLRRRRGHLDPAPTRLTESDSEHEVIRVWNEREDVIAWLRQFKDDPDAIAQLRRWVHNDNISPIPHMSDEDILNRVALQIELGQIEVSSKTFADPDRRGTGKSKGEPSPAQDDEPDEIKPVPVFPTETKEELNFIELLLVDNETGEPMPGVTAKLKLPDGKTSMKTSDSAGRIRVDDVPGGTFDIVEITDDALEVVSVE